MFTKVFHGEGLAIYDNGGQTLAICFLHDLPVGFMNHRELPAAFTGLLDLDTSPEFTTVQLATLALQQTGAKVIIVHQTISADHARQRLPQPMPSIKTLGWQPGLQLVEGLRHITDQVTLPTLSS